MSDRDLLEKAAKAAGIEHKGWWQTMGSLALVDPVGGGWNPLTDDGDAFRLAVRLSMGVHVDFDAGLAIVDGNAEFEEVNTSDPMAAARRAIVRAAAAMAQEAT